MTLEQIFNLLPNQIVEELKVLEQNKKWHPEIYVYDHMVLVYNKVEEYFPDDDELKICAVFHDLGKIDATFLKEDGTPTSPGHETFASSYIDKYCPKHYNIERIKSVCLYHMKAHLFKNGEIKNPKKIKNFESHPYFIDIMKFERCDEEGVGNA